MKARFTPEYEIKTGNIALDYEDTSPAQAEMVLGYIVDDLRELVRTKQIHEATAAVASLKDEAKRSADPMIEAALYQLIATQIQREKMAEVQADFAFTIIEPSAASDIKVWPPTMLFCLLAAFATFAMAAIYIIFIRSNPVKLLREDERTAQIPRPEETKRTGFSWSADRTRDQLVPIGVRPTSDRRQRQRASENDELVRNRSALNARPNSPAAGETVAEDNRNAHTPRTRARYEMDLRQRRSRMLAWHL